MSQTESTNKTSWKDKFQATLDFKLLALLKPYFKEYRVLLIFSFALLLVADLLGVSLPLFIQHGIDVDIKNSDADGLSQTVFYYTVVLISSFLLRVSANYSIAYLGQKLLYSLRLRLFDKVLDLDHKYFDREPTGKTLTNVTNDVESVRQFISEGVVSVLSASTKVFFILIIMFYINPILAIVTLLCIPLFVMITLWFKRSIRDGFREVRQSNSDINTRMVESLNGHREIALFQNRDVSEQQFDKSNKKYLNAYQRIIHAYALYLPIIENISQLSTLVVLIIAHINMGSWVETGQVFAFFALINMFFRPLREIAEQFNTFQSAMAAMERIKKLLEEPVHIQNPKEPFANWRKNHFDLNFEHVHFEYKDNQPVLNDLNFALKSGETIALVGSTGAGKSTIIHLVNRLYDITRGKITINGESIQNYALSDLRHAIATIPQHVFLFTGSVADNIRMFNPDISDQDIQDAINSLDLNDFIQQLPDGLNTQVSEEGQTLSSGQKQLISFARAFVKHPSLLILDEATANIDSETEHQLEKALELLMKERSSIVIAHRLSTIQRADKILVLSQGKVEESGPHEQLIHQNGLYQKLYEMQALSLQTKL
jgi:ATP-binding cassette subfamily B protein